MNYKKLIASLALPQLAGLIGAFFTGSSVSGWYTTIEKPVFTPPGWIFGPAWTLLYLLMGVSLYLVWSRAKTHKKALFVFAVQLVLNTLWSIIFFGLQAPLWGFVEIILLWVAILLTITSFYKINKTAAYLLLPYLAWVSFAAVLNLAIVILN
ncbi:MAG: TspO/MBR family protein [Candidatus Paceibacterota bacterium]